MDIKDIKPKGIEFLKQRTGSNFYYATAGTEDWCEMIMTTLTQDEIDAIRKATSEADEEVEADGGYNNDEERQDVHEEVISALGIETSYCEWMGDTEVTHDCFIHYVDLDSPCLFVSMKYSEKPGSHWVVLTDDEAGDLLMMAIGNPGMTMDYVKTLSMSLYDKIVKVCGTDKVEFKGMQQIVDEFKAYCAATHPHHNVVAAVITHGDLIFCAQRPEGKHAYTSLKWEQEEAGERDAYSLKEHVDCRWLKATEMGEMDWTAADVAIVEAMGVSNRHDVTVTTVALRM